MSAMLSPAELRKLVGILGRLGSDHDGERAAAGRDAVVGLVGAAPAA